MKKKLIGQPNFYTSESVVFQDGEFYPVADLNPFLFSQTLHYGYGIFEGMRSYETADGPKIFKVIEHLERLQKSAKRLNLDFDYTPLQLEEISYQLLEKNNLTNAYIRPLLYTAPNMSLAANRESHLMIMAWKWGRLLGDNLVNLLISDYRRVGHPKALNDLKVCGHYVNNIMAASDARMKGYHDALLLDPYGNLAQGSGANIFMEIDEILYTPPRGNIVPGITRATVIDLAGNMGIPVIEKHLSPKDLYQADSAFLAGTATEIAGIASVNKNKFKMRWEDTTGFILSRKYRQLALRSEKDGGIII